MLQDSKALAGKLDSQALPGIGRLQEALQQLEQRQAATAVQLQADAAATRGQVAQLRQWFDANQVGCMGAVCIGCLEDQHPFAMLPMHSACAILAPGVFMLAVIRSDCEHASYACYLELDDTACFVVPYIFAGDAG